MSLLKLRLSMVGTLAAVIALSTLFFTAVLSWAGIFDIISLALFVVMFNVLQWLFAPYLIDAMYRVREVSRLEEPRLHETVENLCKKSRMKKPKIMIADIPIPNAFAYGSPIAGSRVAVTTGLMDTLEYEEVEAVLGHEVGHLKHRDVQLMMFVSILPALCYWIGYSLLLSARFRGREAGYAGIIGMASLALYWILSMFVLGLSRLREYYADRHSAQTVEEGARKLSEGLAKIVSSTRRIRERHPGVRSFDSFRSLFISDPDHAELDALNMMQANIGLTADRALVERILSRKLTFADRLIELFSTHPNVVKRLRALRKL